jgi:hypothetical protein
MSPSRVDDAPKPPQGSQFGMIFIILLLVFALGALYFKLTGSLL